MTESTNQRVPVSKRHLWWLVIVGPMAGLGIWMLRTFDPNQSQSPFLACVFNQATGLLCPTCGATRAMHALVHFEFGRALSMNALLLIGAPIGFLLILRALGRGPAVLEPVLKQISSPWLWAALVFGFGIARNLPGLEFLAPPA